MAYRKGVGIVSYTRSFPPFILVFQICLTFVRLADLLVYGLTIKGRENLRAIKSAVFISNHTLVVDPGIIAHVIRPKRTYFTMLEETALIPYLGTFVRLLGGVPIPRNSIRQLEHAVVRRLNTLGFVHFFPEGECYLWNQRIRPFSSGASYLACRLRVPVIPVTMVLHERRIFDRRSFSLFGRPLKVPPRLTAVIGKPLYPGQFVSADPARPGRFAAGRPLYSDKFPGNAGRSDQYGAVQPNRHSIDGTVSLRRAAKAMSEAARKQMQATIDREGGCKTLYRGVMPRLVKQKKSLERDAAARGAGKS